MLNGPLAAVLCVIPLLLPGTIANLLLATFVLHSGAPASMRGVLAGASAAAVGLLASTMLQLLPTARKTRFWLISLGAAFGLTMLGVPLLVVLVCCGGASFLVNWQLQRGQL